MSFAFERSTDPVGTPVLLEEMKDWLRVDHEDEDALIHALLYAATAFAEDQTGRALVTQTWQLTLDSFPGGSRISLPMPPLVSVTSVKYTPSGGVQATFDAANYTVIAPLGVIALDSGSSWPGVVLEPGGVIIEYVAGAARTAISEIDKVLIKLVCAHWYENREAATDQRIEGLPYSLQTLVLANRSYWLKPW